MTASIVAGGGPVGSLAALLLARAGIPVTLLEREAGVQLDYRASTFHPPTLDLLEECGAEAALLRMGLKCDTSQFRDREKGKIAEFDHSALRNDTRHPYRLQCEQFKLVDWLHGELGRIPGVELLFNSSVSSVTANEDGVAVQVEDGRTIHGDFLVGADGGAQRGAQGGRHRLRGHHFPGALPRRRHALRLQAPHARHLLGQLHRRPGGVVPAARDSRHVARHHRRRSGGRAERGGAGKPPAGEPAEPAAAARAVRNPGERRLPGAPARRRCLPQGAACSSPGMRPTSTTRSAAWA